MNFLEELAAEWYEYSGYFVRTNVRARKREKGGFGAELDVLAYRPKTQELVHVETSGDADSWAERRRRFLEKKFNFSLAEYRDLLGCDIAVLECVAIVGWSSSAKCDLNWGDGIKVKLIPEFLREIAGVLKQRDPWHEAVPEGYPILRSMQMVVGYCM